MRDDNAVDRAALEESQRLDEDEPFRFSGRSVVTLRKPIFKFNALISFLGESDFENSANSPREERSSEQASKRSERRTGLVLPLHVS